MAARHGGLGPHVHRVPGHGARRLQRHVQRGREAPEAADEAHDAHSQAARPVQAGRRGSEGGEVAVSEVKEITVNVDEYLALDKYEVDEESAHIELVDDPDIEGVPEARARGARRRSTRSTRTARSPSTTRAAWSAAPAASPARAPSSRSGRTPAHDGRGVPVRVGGEQHAQKRTVPSAISYIWRRSLIAHARCSSARTSASPMTKPAFCWNWARLQHFVAPRRACEAAELAAQHVIARVEKPGESRLHRTAPHHRGCA